MLGAPQTALESARQLSLLKRHTPLIVLGQPHQSQSQPSRASHHKGKVESVGAGIGLGGGRFDGKTGGAPSGPSGASGESSCSKAALPPNVHLQTLQPFDSGALVSLDPSTGSACAVQTAEGLVDLSSLAPQDISTPSVGQANDTYRVGFCQYVRCPSLLNDTSFENFGYVVKINSAGNDTCDASFPAPLHMPLVPVYDPGLGSKGGVVLSPAGVTGDGVSYTQVTDTMRVEVHCDPSGQPGVSTALQAQDGVLVFASVCACPGASGCSGELVSESRESFEADVHVHTRAVSPVTSMPADGALIVRLQHLFGPGEHTELSQPTTVDLAQLFCEGTKIASFEELSLSANQRAQDVQHWDWNRASRKERSRERVDGSRAHGVEVKKSLSSENGDGTQLELQPLDIRTFAVMLA